MMTVAYIRKNDTTYTDTEIGGRSMEKPWFDSWLEEMMVGSEVDGTIFFFVTKTTDISDEVEAAGFA